MAIKNLICDLGGVWLPIDEKRTLAAFAALAAGANTKPSRQPTLGSEAYVEAKRRFRADGASAADGANTKPSRQPTLGSEAYVEAKRRFRADGANAADGPDSASAAAVHALAARLQPDVLAYELGAIDDATLLSRLRNALTSAATAPAQPDAQAAHPAPSDEALIQAWNAMLLPFPEAHLPLLDAYGQRYRLFLLSNTNALHIQQVEKDFQSRFPGRKPFLQHFEKAYLSHELHLRKPQAEIYTHVLRDAALRPEETLFIDDRAENIAAAAALGLHTRLHPANAPLTTLPL